MSASISRDEWMQALADAGYRDAEDDQDALTTEEFAQMVGLPRQTAHDRLKKLVAVGKAERTHKWVTDQLGRRHHSVAYRLVK